MRPEVLARSRARTLRLLARVNALHRLVLVLVVLPGSVAWSDSLIPKDVAKMLRQMGHEQRVAETRRIATDLHISPRAQHLLKESMARSA